MAKRVFVIDAQGRCVRICANSDPKAVAHDIADKRRTHIPTLVQLLPDARVVLECQKRRYRGHMVDDWQAYATVTTVRPRGGLSIWQRVALLMQG